MAIVFVGIDLAKNVFAVHGVNEGGKPELVRPNVARGRLEELIAALAPCTIGMEACSGAHHWARRFQAYGHTVKLMAPKFVVPYRLSGKRGKNDAADSAAICEAVQRPAMRFVPVKTAEQQGRLMVHRARQGFVEQRTATLNRIRGLLSEVGIVLPLKACTVRTQATALLEELPGWVVSVNFCPYAKGRRSQDFEASYPRRGWQSTFAPTDEPLNRRKRGPSYAFARKATPGARVGPACARSHTGAMPHRPESLNQSPIGHAQARA